MCLNRYIHISESSFRYIPTVKASFVKTWRTLPSFTIMAPNSMIPPFRKDHELPYYHNHSEFSPHMSTRESMFKLQSPLNVSHVHYS